jgi:radical SAM protein with 4Fe4S-binding SPASM domain
LAADSRMSVMNSASTFHRGLRKLSRAVDRCLAPVLARSGRSPGIKHILFQLTYKCNMRCPFCPQWGQTSTSKLLPAATLKEMLPVAVLKQVINDLPHSCGTVCLWGGEALLYPDVVELVRHIAVSGRRAQLITNGTYLAGCAQELVDAGIDDVAVSIDGLQANHDSMRGAGAYGASLAGIQAVQQARSRRGGRVPTITVGAVLLPEFASEMPEFVAQMHSEGVDRVFFGRLQYTTQTIGLEHEKVFQEAFGVKPTSWKGFVRIADVDRATKMSNTIAALRSDPRYKDFVVWETPHWGIADYHDYYMDPSHTQPSNRACRFPWQAVCVYANGDLSPCPDFPDFVVGNVLRQPFPEIWNGAPFRKFRTELRKRGRFPICTSCCQLHTD